MPNPSTLFAIMAVGKPEALKTVIEAKYSDQATEVAPGQWLIVRPSTMTTLEIANELGIYDGSTSGAIVLSVASYNGRTRPSTWEWISAKTGATTNVSQAG
jgi:hypothetical protein